MSNPRFFSGKINVGGRSVQWESTFPIGTKYSCKKCGLCCNLVSLTPRDVHTLQKAGVGDSINYPSEDNPIKIPSLKMRDDGNCIHLTKDNLCPIYKNRPMMCKSYPFIITPGPDGNVYVDLSLRCPYIDDTGLPEIKKRDIVRALDLNRKQVPKMIMRAVEYRKSLADHVRIGYGPALVSRKKRIEFMERSLLPLEKLNNPVDLPGIMKVWSDVIGQISHKVLVQRDNGILKGRSQDSDILRNLPEIDEEREYQLDPNRWRYMFEDIGDYVFTLNTAEKVHWSKIEVGKTIKINGKTIRWEELTFLSYSKEAMDEVLKYLKMLLRRPSFELTVARVAEYLIDYKNVPVTDYEISSMLFSNAVIIHLDPIARVLANILGNEQIEKEDVKLAISNLDSELLSALTDGTLAKVMIKRLDVPDGVKW